MNMKQEVVGHAPAQLNLRQAVIDHAPAQIKELEKQRAALQNEFSAVSAEIRTLAALLETAKGGESR